MQGPLASTCVSPLEKGGSFFNTDILKRESCVHEVGYCEALVEY